MTKALYESISEVINEKISEEITEKVIEVWFKNRNWKGNGNFFVKQINGPYPHTLYLEGTIKEDKNTFTIDFYGKAVYKDESNIFAKSATFAKSTTLQHMRTAISNAYQDLLKQAKNSILAKAKVKQAEVKKIEMFARAVGIN